MSTGHRTTEIHANWTTAGFRLAKTQSRLSKVVATEIYKNVMKQKLHISLNVVQKKKWAE